MNLINDQTFEESLLFKNYILMVAVMIIAIIAGLSFIKIPSYIEFDILIKSKNHPVKLSANTMGNFRIVAEEGVYYKKGELIGYFNKDLYLDDYKYLKKILADKDPDIKESYQDIVASSAILNSYSTWKSALKEYNDLKIYIQNNKDKLAYLSDQQIEFDRINKFNSNNLELDNELYEIKRKQLKSDSLAFKEGLISQEELERKREITIGLKSSINSNKISHTNNKTSMLNLDYEKKRNNFEMKTKFIDLESRIALAKNNLVGVLSKWEEDNIVLFQDDGYVIFSKNINDSNTINYGEIIGFFYKKMSGDKEKYFGTADISREDIHKIKKGQKMEIIIDGYNKNKFGTILGTINKVYNISEQVNTNRITIDIENFVTNYKKEIKFVEDIKGKGRLKKDEEMLLTKVFQNYLKIAEK